jgi:uncharacterized phage protein (predicted DNA packaging)
MKVSIVSVSDIKNYLRIDADYDDNLITSILAGAKSYIKSYTGLDDATIDDYEDITIALFALCSEMYDNRRFIVEKNTVNPITQSIIDIHSINLL